MVKTHNRIRKTLMQLALAGTAFSSLGAVVVAAPSVFGMGATVPGLASLASGPMIQLAKAGPGAFEDCVRVTRMVGPDGKEYPTNGMVCSGD